MHLAPIPTPLRGVAMTACILLGLTPAATGQTGYTAGNSGTILKTTDGGSNWSTQTSGTTENLRGVSFPLDDTNGYVVGWNGTILKTGDGGGNWSSQTSGTTDMLLAVDFPVDTTTGYTVGETGTILKTTDGGSNWNSQTSGTTEELRGVDFPVDATTGYAVGKNEVILKTTDGGANWVVQNSGSGPNYRGLCFPVDATTGYVVGNDGTILKTTDGGSNWNAQTSGTTEHLFAVDFPVDATTGYAVGDDGTILKTTDGGANWNTLTSGTGDPWRGVHFPLDATTGYVTGSGGLIHETTDGGSNWSPQTSGTTEELRPMLYPGRPAAYVVGNNGTVLKSTDAGATWNAQTSGTTNNFFDVGFPVAGTGYAVASNGDIRKTTDGGANWAAQTSGTTEHLYSVDFPIDDTTGYATATNGTIIKTTDGGTNWNPQTSGTTEHLQDVYFPVDATTGYIVGNTGTILKTSDGGGNWNAQSSGTNEELYAVLFPLNASTGYVVGDWGTILKTTDGGSNWNDQNAGLTDTLRDIAFPVDAVTGWAVGDQGTIITTTDGGSNWSTQTSGTTEALHAVHFDNDELTGYALGWNGTILKTTDGGSNWGPLTSGTTEHLRSIRFPGNGGVSADLVLADHGAGQQPDAFSESGSETDAELLGFELDPGGQSRTVTELVCRLSGISGLTDFDWVFVELLEDDDGSGDIDLGETTAVGGAGAVDQASGTITFSSAFTVSAATDYILRADFPDLEGGDTVTISLSAGDITTTASISGSTSAVSHREIGAFYNETYEEWQATVGTTWEVQDLSVSPFNVPADAVVEVAIINTRAVKENSAGVRTVGSGVERRLSLREAEAGGIDVAVMHVQADGSSRIEHYAENPNDVRFALLGYWRDATYVERYDLITAGADLTWTSKNLGGFGVTARAVAEMAIVNIDPASEWEGGVRASGSSLERRLDLAEAESGGVDAVTMMVLSGSTSDAAIEVYSENDWQIEFYLLGYFSSAPRSFQEAFVDVGGPSASATWEDKDLTSHAAPADTRVEFVLANTEATAESQMGVRLNGSSVARLLDLQEAEDGGGDLGRLHVMTDVASIIEVYHENIANPHAFYMTGYWRTRAPRIAGWEEVEP